MILRFHLNTNKNQLRAKKGIMKDAIQQNDQLDQENNKTVTSHDIFNKNKSYVRTIQKFSKLVLKLLDVDQITINDIEFGKKDKIIAHYNQTRNRNYIFIVNKSKYEESNKKFIDKDRMIDDPLAFIKKLQQILQILNKKAA